MKTEIVWDFFFCWFMPIGLMALCIIGALVVLVALFNDFRG